MPVWEPQEEMIVDSAVATLTRHGGLARVRDGAADGRQTDSGLLRTAAEQGWIGILVPEAFGGLGRELRDALVLTRTIGRFVAPEPIALSIATALFLSELKGMTALLERAISGEEVVLAVPVQSRADGLESALTPGIGLADVLIMVEESRAIHVVRRDDPRLTIDAWPTRDGGTTGRAILAKAGENTRQTATGVYPASLVRLLQASELSGLAAEVFDRARAHLDLRKQFGKPLSSFQVLRNRSADIHIANSAGDAVIFEAARAYDGQQRDFAVRTAWRAASLAAERACKEAIQFHGAMGIAEECDIGLFQHRFMAIVSAQRQETIRIVRG